MAMASADAPMKGIATLLGAPVRVLRAIRELARPPSSAWLLGLIHIASAYAARAVGLTGARAPTRACSRSPSPSSAKISEIDRPAAASTSLSVTKGPKRPRLLVAKLGQDGSRFEPDVSTADDDDVAHVRIAPRRDVMSGPGEEKAKLHHG